MVVVVVVVVVGGILLVREAMIRPCLSTRVKRNKNI